MKNINVHVVGSVVSTETHSKAEECNGELNGAWESKLSDVVKGVAKGKGGQSHAQAQHHQQHKQLQVNGAVGGSSSSSVAVSASKAPVDSQPTCPLPNGDLAQSTLALTPPTSPGKKDRPFHAAAANNNNNKTKSNSSTTATPLTAEVVQLKATPAAPCVSYAKVAEQSKDKMEQLAREVKERDLEQERERRREIAVRVSQTSE